MMDPENIPRETDGGPTAASGDSDVTIHFLRLSGTAMGRLARSKRLRENDVLVAIDGEMFQGDSNALGMIFSQDLSVEDAEVDEFEDDEDDEKHRRWLLTFYRDGVFFHQVYNSALIAHFEYETGEKALEIQQKFTQLQFRELSRYQNFEIFRAQDGRCALHSVEPSEMATIIPLLWMLNNKLFYPMLAISIIYTITFLTSLILFIPTYVMVSMYTKKAQLDLLRSFQLFKDRHYWATLAATNEMNAQMNAMEMDSKIRFSSRQATKKKKKRNPAAS